MALCFGVEVGLNLRLNWKNRRNAVLRGRFREMVCICDKKVFLTPKNEWKRRVSIPVPRACEARALPIELRSRWREGSNSSYKFLLSVYRQQASFKSSPQSLLWLGMLPWYACISQAWAWPCGCLFTAGFRVSLAGYRVRVPPCWAGPPGPGGRCYGCLRTLASVYQCLGSCWSLILSVSHCLNYRRSLRAYQQTSL